MRASSCTRRTARTSCSRLRGTARLRASPQRASRRPRASAASWEARSIAVEDRPAADAQLLVALPAAPREVPQRRADPAGEDEPGGGGAGSHERELRLQLAGDVRGVTELVPQLLDGAGELIALGAQLGADLFGRACGRGHQRLIASVVNLASRIACSGTGGVAFWIRPRASNPSSAASRNSATVTISSASHHGRNVASAAAIVAKTNPRPKSPKIAAPTPIPMPTPSTVTLFFSSSVASSTSTRAIADACSATDFAAPPTPPFACASDAGVCMPPPVEDLRQQVAARQRGADHEPRTQAAARLRLLRPLELRA